MKTALQRLDDGSIKLTVTIPWEKVVTTREKVLGEVQKKAKIAGFRPGKAPKKVVADNVDNQAIQEDVLKQLLPETYMAAIKEHSIQPIMNPKVHVEKLEEGKDWVFEAITCEMPEITLGKYKDEVQKITAKSKIIVPGKEVQEPNFEDIVKAITASVKTKIPAILVEQEVDRLLSQTLNEIKSLGLTLDQYLASTGKNPQQLREEYGKKAQADVTFEFTLQKIAEAENITVEEKEIEEAITKAKDPTERQHLEANRYLLASIIRQQKTLDFLKHL